MAGLLALFRNLHRIHRLAHDLQEHLKRLPAQLKAHRARVARAETALKEAQDLLKQTKVGILERESSLKAKAQQIQKYDTQINTVTSKKEFDALKSEIAHTKQECARLEDEVLVAMTQVDERSAALPALEKALKEAREELAKVEAHAQEKQDSLGQDLANVSAELKEAEKGLPADMRQAYDRMIKAMGADALSPVRNRTCQACSTEITAQQQNNLLMDRLVFCPSCGRVLYLPE